MVLRNFPSDVSLPEFTEMWLGGSSRREIAEKFGRSCPSWASKVAALLGLSERENPSSLATIDRRKFETMWNAGDRNEVISEAFGRSSGSWASKMAARLGLPPRQSNGRTTRARAYVDGYDREEIVRMRRNGRTLSAIAEIMECDIQVVRNTLDSMGYSPMTSSDVYLMPEDF